MFARKKKRFYLTGEEIVKRTDENKALMLPQNSCSDGEYRVGGGEEIFQGEKEGALHQAIVKGDVEAVKGILGSRVLADVNLIMCCASLMKTPLVCAVTCGSVEIVGMLVECGADVNLSCGINKDMPLHMAVDMVTQDNTVAMLQLLLKLGAIPDAKNGKGETPLHKAAKNGDMDCVAVLLNFGANSREKDCLERTALHYAVVGKGTWKANLECVRLLLEDSRIDVNAQDIQGYTALHLSAGNENSRCAALLLRHGSDVTLRTSTGITALSMLARNLPDVISCLVDRFNGAITIQNQCDPSDPNCEIKMDFSVLLPKQSIPLSVDKPSKTRQKKETELLTCLVNTGNKKLLAHPLSSAFLLLKWRRVRKFFLASLLFQMMIVALFTIFVVEVYLIRCPYTREPVSTPSHSLSKRYAHAHPNPYPNPMASPAEDQRGFSWFRVVPSKKKHKIPEGTTVVPPLHSHGHFPSTPITFGAFAPQSPTATFNRQPGRSNNTETNQNERPAESIAAGEVVPGEQSGDSDELESATPPAAGFTPRDFRRKMIPTPPTEPEVSPPQPPPPQPEVEEELPRCRLNWPIYLIWLLLITCISVMALQEIFQLVHSPRRYVVSSENWAQWLLIVSVMLTAWIRSNHGSNGDEALLEYWQYPAAACGILIAWALILFQVGRFPSLGLYVEMLGKVAANFGIFIMAYACLLIAFALSFCVLFPEHPPFSSVPLSILKVFTMMVGEVDYEDLFYSEERSHDPILFPLTAHLLFGAFVLIMTIVLMNLLVGLAVSDIQGLQRGAKLDRLSRQTALIARFESFIFSKKLQTLLPASLVCIIQENSLLALSSDSDDKPNWLLYFRPNDPRDRTLPKDIKQESLNLITLSHSSLPRQPYFYHQNVSKDESVAGNIENLSSKKAERSVSSISHLNQLKSKNYHACFNNRSDSTNSSDSHKYSTDNSKASLDQRLNHVEIKLENMERGINSILKLLSSFKQDPKS